MPNHAASALVQCGNQTIQEPNIQKLVHWLTTRSTVLAQPTKKCHQADERGKIGQWKRCQNCGMLWCSSKGSWRTVKRGWVYYFCHKTSLATFKKSIFASTLASGLVVQLPVVPRLHEQATTSITLPWRRSKGFLHERCMYWIPLSFELFPPLSQFRCPTLEGGNFFVLYHLQTILDWDAQIQF